MSVEEDFAGAQQRVQTLPKRPSNDTLLQLYGLYKQGSAGDVTGKRPGMLDLKGRAKFDAWEARKGMAKDAAQKAYAELVNRLVSGR